MKRIKMKEMIESVFKKIGITPNVPFMLKHYLGKNQNKWIGVEFMFDGDKFVSTDDLVIEIKDIIYLLVSGIYTPKTVEKEEK